MIDVTDMRELGWLMIDNHGDAVTVNYDQLDTLIATLQSIRQDLQPHVETEFEN